MDIKSGEYVRTDNGKIFKVLEVEKGSVKIKSDYREWIGICCIKKHSFNIIDLIEVGDYVNGKLIHHTDIRKNSAYIYYGNGKTFVDYQIKSIVTKEQFDRGKYVVGE